MTVDTEMRRALADRGWISAIRVPLDTPISLDELSCPSESDCDEDIVTYRDSVRMQQCIECLSCGTRSEIPDSELYR